MKIYIIAATVLFCVSCGNKQNVSESDTMEIEYSQIPIPKIMDERIKQMYSTDNISAFEKEIELAYNDDMSVYNTSSYFIDSLFMIEKDTFRYNHGGLFDNYHHSKYYQEIEKDIFRTNIVMDYMEYNWSTQGMARMFIYKRLSYLKLIDKYYHILLTELDDKKKVLLIENQKKWTESYQSNKNLMESIFEPSLEKYPRSEHAIWNAASTNSKCTDRLYFLFNCLYNYEEVQEFLSD